MEKSIPLSSPDITQAEIDAVIDALKSPTLSGGPRIEQFEQICARMAGRRHGIAVSSGPAGLHLCMLAAGLQPGDEVITTPFSFVATTQSILHVNAKPVFVDIDPKTLNLDLVQLERAITPRTSAILAVETFGHPGGMCELEQIAQRHELPLVEDCCEGFGGAVREPALGGEAPHRIRPIGSFGRAGVFGFHSNNQITTGEGGMIVTDDDRFASLCRSYRNHGRDGLSWLTHTRLGFDYRMSEINAALGTAQAGRIEQIINARQSVANLYMRRLMGNRYLILPNIDEATHMSWFAFVVRLSDQFDAADRDELIMQLQSEGIGASNYFSPIHLQPYVREKLGTKPGDFPVCEHVAARTIALPFFNRLTEVEVNQVCDLFERLIDRRVATRKSRD